MYIEAFKVFSDVAETRSFSKAAALNSITQSAVSQQVRGLENRFQVTLVERGHRSIQLTEQGHIFLAACREMLEVYGSLHARLHAARDIIAGELRIASIYSIGLHELPPILKEFRRKHPQVEMHVEYRRSGQVYQQVMTGHVDFGLVAYPARRAGLQVDIFDADELVLICHPSHALARESRIPLSRLNGEKLISFEPDVPTRKVVDRILRDEQVQIEHTMEFDNIETVKRAVEVESGVSIVPRNTVRQEVESGILVAVEIASSQLVRPLGVITKRNRARTSAQNAFTTALMAAGGGVRQSRSLPESDVADLEETLATSS